MNARIEAELDLADATIAQMRDSIGRLRQHRDEGEALTAYSYGMLPQADYENALANERRSCLSIDDAITVVEFELDRELEVDEELGLYKNLRRLALNPGDLIGKLDETRYQLAFPWTDGGRGTMMQGYVAGIIADTLPDLTTRIGSKTFTAAVQTGSVALVAAPNRTPIIRSVGRTR